MRNMSENMSKENKRNKILREILMGCGIVAVILGGTAITVGQAFSLHRKAKSEDIAVQILHSEMQHLRSLEWDEIDRLPSWGRFDPVRHSSIFPFGNFRSQRIITPRGDSEKEIRLIFTWKEGIVPEANKRQFVTYVTKDGYHYTVITPPAPNGLDWI